MIILFSDKEGQGSWMRHSFGISEDLQTKIYAHSGLQYDKSSGFFLGRSDGYLCQLYVTSQAQSLRIAARMPADTEITQEEVNLTFRQLCVNDPMLTSCELTGFCVTAAISCEAAHSPAVIARILKNMTDTCRSLGLTTCCMECGAASCRNVAIGSMVQALCADCEQRRSDEIRTQVQGSPNLLFGLAAAVVGGIVSFLAIYLLWQLDTIVYCAGIAGFMVAAGIGSKLEKALTRPTLILSTILCLIGSCFASFYTMSEDLADAFAVARELTYTQEEEALYREQLERLELIQQMSDEELSDAFSEYSAAEIAELKASVPEMLETTRLDLQDFEFVKTHTKPMECLLDIREAAQWSEEPGEVWRGILENLIPSVLILLITGVMALTGKWKNGFHHRSF